jgi:acyl dehydratase
MDHPLSLEHLAVGDRLSPVSVVAHNFALDSDNKIHDDEVARKYGFKGGLVPGVADYDYMVRPVSAKLGLGWLDSGWAEARFLEPIYDGDTVEARARVTRGGAKGVVLELELADSTGVVCAQGRAGLGDVGSESGKGFDLDFAPADFEAATLPATDRRPDAGVATMPRGMVLGSLEIEARTAEVMASLAERYNDPDLVRGQGLAPLPSSYYLDRANEILSSNVLLGPWIHVGSQIEHHSIPTVDEPLQMRGRVHDSYERKGHEFVVLDLVVAAQEQRVASVRHTAIVKPRSQ